MSTEADVRAVAVYLRDCAHSAVTTHPTPASMQLDGEAFWVTVARAAVALGARAELRPLYGPVRSLGEVKAVRKLQGAKT